jgi:hypothetical protein
MRFSRTFFSYSAHRPHAESVDVSRLVDLVLEVLFGDYFVIMSELELFRVHARV